MTTIAYCRRTRVLAADSSYKLGESKYLCKDKAYRLKDGSLFAGAGDSKDVSKLRRFLEGELKRPPKLSEVEALRVFPDGRVMLYVHDHDGDELLDDTAAIGTGAVPAKVAFSYGASPREAVEKACEFDDGSCGPVHEYRLDG